MSDNKQPSEYLKRTCLICGCHTNQTINIYEPRSGPNIVQLIQAKFKFQPLNEDKYLCFSCNNWLINWHSLQALNSNDAESPSGTFRPQMNGMVQQGEEAYDDEQQRARLRGGGGGNDRQRRPVAQVKPMQLSAEVTENSGGVAAMQSSSRTPTDGGAGGGSNNVKRNFRATKVRRVMRKDLKRGQYALPRTCACGRTVAVCVSSLNALKKAAAAATTTTYAKCQRCRSTEAARRRNVLREQIQEQMLVNGEEVMEVEQSNNNTKAEIPNNYNKSNNNKNQSQHHIQQQQQQQAQNFLRRPLVDGKIISMLRRVGTTLTREQQQQQEEEVVVKETTEQQQQDEERENLAPIQNRQQKYSKLPQIMSPVKSKPRWTRQLEEDEILLAFNTAISEVLPANICSIQAQIAAEQQFTVERQIEERQQQQDTQQQQQQFKRKLEYHITVDCKEAIPATLAFVPQGLSISLV